MRGRVRANAGVWAAVLLSATGCGSKPAEQPAAADPGPATATAAAAEPAAAPSASALLRCGDFIDAAQIKALGLDASDFKPDEKQSNPGLGVRCTFGAASATLFRGDDFKSMVGGLEALGKESGVQTHPGPTIGSETRWTRMGPMEGMLFLSTNKRYAASLAGRDQAQLENLGKQLDVNMSAR